MTRYMGKSRIQMPELTVGPGDFGRHLASIRKKRGLSQTKLADKIGTIQANISAYEKNKLRLNAEIILRLAVALNVSTDELLGYAHEQQPHKMPLKLIRRMQKIQELPDTKQKILLRTIDDLLRSYLS